MHNLHVMAVLLANIHAQQAASTHPTSLCCGKEESEASGSLPQLRCSIPRTAASFAYLHNLCTMHRVNDSTLVCVALCSMRQLRCYVESGKVSFVCAIAFQRE